MAAKILITEKFAEEGLKILTDKGYEVDVRLKVPASELPALVADYDALIVRSATKVNAEVINAAKKLRIIGRAGVSVDNIDVEAATERGIVVCNAPTSNIVSAAEHTMALMMACARNVVQANESVHAGEWSRGKFVGYELYEKTLAIFGLGRIGGLVAERARAFGMNLIGYDPYCSAERAEQLGVTLYEDFSRVLSEADFITVHLPKTEETIDMFGPDEFAKMKDGVILVNAARGGIFNEKSMADFIAAGKIAAVGIDCFAEEPLHDSPLSEFPNAVLTPHIGAYTKEAQARAGIQIAQYVASGLSGSIVPTALNMAPVPPEVMDAVGPYVPVCQMMGSMLAQIEGDIPKTLNVTAAGTLAGTDASILVAGALKGLLSYKKVTSVSPVNADAVAQRHGIKVSTFSRSESDGYASQVAITADGVEIAATLAGEAQVGRLTSLLGYKLDVAPAKQSLIFEYDDAPGRIGTIGTVLGAANVNITSMQISPREETKTALVFMNVEGEVTQEVLAQLHEALKDLKNLWHISL